MLRFALFAVLVVAACAVPVRDDMTSSELGNIRGCSSIDEYLAENPDAEIIAELEAVELQSTNDSVTTKHEWGKREMFDHPAGKFQTDRHLLKAQDVVLEWNWPAPNSRCYQVTWISVKFERTNKDGKVYLVSGGVDHRSFKLLAETKQTLHYRLDGTVYGYKC